MDLDAYPTGGSQIAGLIRRDLKRSPLYRLITKIRPDLESELVQKVFDGCTGKTIFSVSGHDGTGFLAAEERKTESEIFKHIMSAVDSILSDTYKPSVVNGLLDQLMDWIRETGLEFVSYRTGDIAGTIELKTVVERLLLRRGFYPIETYLTFVHNLSGALILPLEEEGAYTFALSTDTSTEDPAITRITEIARRSFSLSRFHLDPFFNSSLADQNRISGMMGIIRGRGKLIYSTDGKNGRITGFIGYRNTVLGRDRASFTYSTIELLAVDPDFHDRGGISPGAHLIHRCLEEVKHHGAAFCLVGTPARNVSSIRLYEKSFFRLLSCSYTYHWRTRRST